MSTPRVLLLAAEPGISLQVLFCLEAMGAETHVIASPRARHLRFASACASFEVMAFEDRREPAAQLAAELDAHARAHAIDVIVPSDMPSTRYLVDLQPHLTTGCMPLPERAVFNLVDDKFALNEKLHDLGLPAPRTVFIGPVRHLSLPLIEREIGYPLVIKPTDQGNSNGVVICRGRDDVMTHVINNPHYPYERLIAQEYIPGYDIDLSLFAVNGRVVSSAVQRRIGKAIHFLAAPEFVDVGRQIIGALNYSGPAHFDGRYDSRDGAIKIIECNPRFWASITAALRCGVNFVAEGVDAGLASARDEAVSVTSGAYIPPTAFLASLLTKPWQRALWTRRNFAGLTQALHNFAPYLSEEWRARSRQLAERRRTCAGHTFVPGLRFGKG